MKLEAITYREDSGGEKVWTLERSKLGGVSLIVGKNASGKTRVVNVIHGLAAAITNNVRPLWNSGKFDAEFSDMSGRYRYTLEVVDRSVKLERLTHDDEVVLERDAEGAGFAWSARLSQRLDYKVSKNQLAIVYRRDEIQHPFIEPLYGWAQSVRRYLFGSELGRSVVYPLKLSSLEQTSTETVFPASTDPNQVVQLYAAGFEQFDEKFDRAILSDFRKIGYNCTEVGSDHYAAVSLPDAIPLFLFVKEADLPGRTWQIEMSMGMYRALALIIHINYVMMSRQPSCVIIDDIGEGLDFDRSTKLIHLLMDKCIKKDLQLIMTTNDRFVMNEVSLEHWHVIDRKGARVRLLDAENSRATFEDFSQLGLNNFDFFSSEAYRTKKPRETRRVLR